MHSRFIRQPDGWLDTLTCRVIPRLAGADPEPTAPRRAAVRSALEHRARQRPIDALADEPPTSSAGPDEFDGARPRTAPPSTSSRRRGRRRRRPTSPRPARRARPRPPTPSARRRRRRRPSRCSATR
jgi:hypothetical protein